MTTRITVATGDGGLLERNAQQQAANRQGTLVKGQAEQAAATGAEQQRQRRIAAGLDPATGRPLPSAGSTSRLPRIDQDPAAFRSGFASLQFLPPAAELAASPYTGPQYLDDINNIFPLDKWWAPQARGISFPLAVGEPEEFSIYQSAVRLARHGTFTQDNYFIVDINELAEITPGVPPSQDFMFDASIESYFKAPFFTLRYPRRRSLRFSCVLVAGQGQEVNAINGNRVGYSFTTCGAGVGGRKADLSRYGIGAEIGAFADDSILQIRNRLEIRVTTILPYLEIPIEQGSVNVVTMEMTAPNLFVLTHNESRTEIQSGVVQDFLDCAEWSMRGSAFAIRARSGLTVPLPPPPDVSAKVGRISIEWDR